MGHGLKVCLLALSLAGAVSACDWGGDGDSTGALSAQATTSTSQEPTIESSLEGLTVLPARIRWSATTSVPPAQVKKVYFLVDGDRWWEDSVPPYTFGPSGAYLPARWITSLPIGATGHTSHTHEFKVRVIATDGERWSATVSARTPGAQLARQAPGMFGLLRGGGAGYGRLSDADVANPPRPGDYPAYKVWMAFIGASLFVRRANVYHGFAWEMSSDRTRIYLGTPIFLAEGAHVGNPAGYARLEQPLCPGDDSRGIYAWTETRGRVRSTYKGKNDYWRNLTLRAVHEPCNKRKRLVEGVWDELAD
jgi:hypothetical protein